MARPRESGAGRPPVPSCSPPRPHDVVELLQKLFQQQILSRINDRIKGDHEEGKSVSMSLPFDRRRQIIRPTGPAAEMDEDELTPPPARHRGGGARRGGGGRGGQGGGERVAECDRGTARGGGGDDANQGVAGEGGGDAGVRAGGDGEDGGVSGGADGE